MTSPPRKDEPGRLDTLGDLRPGWPCRWCHLGLLILLPRDRAMTTAAVCCPNCDNPQGVTPR